jgi:hypothetical protein
MRVRTAIAAPDASSPDASLSRTSAREVSMTDPSTAKSPPRTRPSPWTELRLRLEGTPDGPIAEPVATALLDEVTRAGLLRRLTRWSHGLHFPELHAVELREGVLRLRAGFSRYYYRYTVEWALDLAAEAARLVAADREPLAQPRIQPRLDVRPIAAELATAILRRRRDPRLSWSSGGRVRVVTRVALPASGNRTLHDRRTNLRAALMQRLSRKGWRAASMGWIDPPGHPATAGSVELADLAASLAESVATGAADPRLRGDPLEWRRFRVRMRVVFGRGRSRRRELQIAEFTEHMVAVMGADGWVPCEDGWWRPGTPAGHVGWLCSSFRAGRYALCRSCGLRRPPTARGRASSKPLDIDDVRPHPQRCKWCRRTIVHGIVPKLRERF